MSMFSSHAPSAWAAFRDPVSMYRNQIPFTVTDHREMTMPGVAESTTLRLSRATNGSGPRNS
ncbi:MAG: hypothetical protein QOK18_4777 [Mycobacterium sp.]|nr:hypothetical protein [Mycobacterium sp.]